MRRVLSIILALSLMGCTTTPPDRIGDACEIFDEKRNWYRAASRAERRHGTPKALQLAIIRQESSFRHDAKPPRGRFLFVFPGKRKSSARGYPQALDSTWDLYRQETGNRRAERDEFRDATDFVAWYAKRSSVMADVPLDDPYRQYLAYHEGPGGYLRGTYRNKPYVLEAASRVEWVYRTYDAQLAQCESRFRRGIPLIPGI